MRTVMEDMRYPIIPPDYIYVHKTRISRVHEIYIILFSIKCVLFSRGKTRDNIFNYNNCSKNA